MVLAPCGFSGLGNRRYRSYFEAMPERLRSYDALILHSTVYQDWDFARAAGAENIFIIPNGADSPVADTSLRSKLPSGSIAVTVGSHVISKGHAEFARSIRRLARERPLTGVVVAPPRHGLDALRGCQLTCNARARRQPLRILDGSVPGTVATAIAAADLFLFTSRVECAPLVILEAMAGGTPWVSYNVGNVSELAGGIVVADAHEQQAAAAEILDGKRPELGAQGHLAWESEHRWEQVIPRYESTFAAVLEGSRAPAS
jgi:glycosyltransferase involved in cell wall biosynthesis